MILTKNTYEFFDIGPCSFQVRPHYDTDEPLLVCHIGELQKWIQPVKGTTLEEAMVEAAHHFMVDLEKWKKQSEELIDVLT